MSNSKPASILSTSTVAGFNPRAAAALFKLDVMDMFNAWNADKPLRTGFPHASNILAPEAEFCLRKLVLMAIYPEQAVRPEPKPWDAHQNAVFKNGWMIHQKYQELEKKYGRVIYTNGEAELDLTHFDETRLVYYSPDIVKDHYSMVMPVEIKGYNDEHFQKLDEAGDPPLDAHRQVNFYEHLYDAAHGLILVENKNNQDIKTWCVPYDREMAQPYIERNYAFKKHYTLMKEQGKSAPARKCEKSTDRLAQKCEMCQFCFKH